MRRLSIDAPTSVHFRNLGERLIHAATLMESGSALRDVDPTWGLVRAVSSILGEKPTYESRLATLLRSENEQAAVDHPLGALILEVLSLSKRWTGRTEELSEIGEELELPCTIDVQMFDVRHWFSRGIAAAGALAHIRDDGSIHLARHQWFSLASRSVRKLNIQNGDAPRPVRQVLRGAWSAQGINPDLCIYCLSAPFEEIEHFVPRSRGGTNDLSNLLPACIKCNRGRNTGKHDKDPWEWLESVHPQRLDYFQGLFGVMPIDN